MRGATVQARSRASLAMIIRLGGRGSIARRGFPAGTGRLRAPDGSFAAPTPSGTSPNQAQEELGKAQRDYILREQMKQIQKELGESEPEQAEALLLRERIEKADLPDEVRAEADRELKRLERLPTAAPDYHVIRTYLDWILDLPWKKSTGCSG